MKALQRFWHVIRDRHVGTWIETRCGVAHHVCRCGWVTPARKLGPTPATSKDKYDFDKAVRARRLSTARDHDRQRLEVRRADAANHDKPAKLHRFDDRRSAR